MPVKIFLSSNFLLLKDAQVGVTSAIVRAHSPHLQAPASTTILLACQHMDNNMLVPDNCPLPFGPAQTAAQLGCYNTPSVCSLPPLTLALYQRRESLDVPLACRLLTEQLSRPLPQLLTMFRSINTLMGLVKCSTLMLTLYWYVFPCNILTFASGLEAGPLLCRMLLPFHLPSTEVISIQIDSAMWIFSTSPRHH